MLQNTCLLLLAICIVWHHCLLFLLCAHVCSKIFFVSEWAPSPCGLLKFNRCHICTDLWAKLCYIFTAHIHTYDGRLHFHRCVSVQLLGGYPIPGLGRGVPHPRSGWGVPHPDGVPPRHGTGYPPRHGMGYPPDMGWGTFPRPGMGYPPRHETGYPQDLRWGTPPLDRSA